MKIIKIKDTYEKAFVETFSKSYFSSKKEAKAHFRTCCISQKMYILVEGTEVLGFFNYFYQYSHYANYLEDICVARKYRGKKLSRILLNKYIEISRKEKTKNTIALSSTHKKNKISQKMHEQFGFKKIGILKKLHYGVDEIFYAYDL